MESPTKTTRWLCDVPGCDQEFDIKIDCEKICIMHAREKAQEDQDAKQPRN